MADNKKTEPVEITIGDFNSVVNVIDVCSARGAFRGEELASIGMLRQKFAGAVEAETAKQQAAVPGMKPNVEVIDGGADDVQPAKVAKRTKKSTTTESLN